LSIGVGLPRKRSCCGGRRKRHRIEVVCGVSSPLGDPLACPASKHGPVPPSILCDVTSMSPRPQGRNLSSLISIPLQDSAIPLSKSQPLQKLKVASFNAQSLGPTCQEKRSLVYDFISENSIDILLIQETWFKEKGDEGKLAELAPPGYSAKSFPRSHHGGGLAVV